MWGEGGLFGIIGSSLHWWCYVTYWSPTLLVGGRWWSHPILPSLQMGDCTRCYSGSLHRKANNLPFCDQGFSQIPALTLSVPRPLACPMPQFSCVLSLVHGWNLKLQILRDHKWCELTLILWKRASLSCASCCFIPEKQSHHCIGGWSLWWCSEKQWPVYLPSLHASVPC